MTNLVPPVQVEMSPFVPLAVVISQGFEVEVQLGPDSKPYQGSYVFTPSDEEQTIEIQGKTASHNIVIEAIPCNYGRIVWDGVTLKVY